VCSAVLAHKLYSSLIVSRKSQKKSLEAPG
jgi:hypothetical protein